MTNSLTRLGLAASTSLATTDLADPGLTVTGPVLSDTVSGSSTTNFFVNFAIVPVIASGGPSHMTINVSYDASVTALNTVGNAAYNPALYANYLAAVNTAVSYYQTHVTSPITLNIVFGWGNVGGTTDTITGALGQSSSQFTTVTYSQLQAAVRTTDSTNAVQRAAAALLTPTDPTGGAALFAVTTADAKALGLSGASSASDGGVGLNSSYTYAFSQSSVASSGNYDAVAVLEHEISEVMGRNDLTGQDLFSTGQQDYSLMDMFRYTAAGNAASAAPGTAVGALDLPFVTGYSAANQSYFSYNGSTVTLPYDSPADVAAGNDVADWSSTLSGDSFGSGTAGVIGAVSATDQQVLSVLGYAGIACYAAGTRLATDEGEVAVEDLAVGDRLITVDGSARPVRWIGHRSIDITRHARPAQVQPILVCADAFGPRLPRRDLLLSPDHAVYADDVLIPVRHLVNGSSIRRESVAAVTYYHVELDAHAVILAEGLPAESYLDTGNRANFVGGAALTLHPEWGGADEPAQALIWEARAAAPLCVSGPVVDALRTRLACGGALQRHAAVATSVA